MPQIDKQLVLTLVVVLFATLTINMMLTKFLMARQFDAFMERLQQPQIQVVDFDALFLDVAKSNQPQDAFAFADNLRKAAAHKGVLIIDAKAVIALPEKFKLETVSPSSIKAYLKGEGIHVSEPDDFKAKVRESNAQLDQLLKPASNTP